MSKITVTACLPWSAYNRFDECPRNKMDRTEYTHAFTATGLKNAIKRVKSISAEYTRTHGNGAAKSVWICVDGEPVSLFEAQCMSRPLTSDQILDLRYSLRREREEEDRKFRAECSHEVVS